MRKNKVVMLTIFLSIFMGSVHAAQTSDSHNMQGMSMSGNNQMDMQKDIDKMKSDMAKMHTNMSNAKTPEAMQKVMQDQMQMIQKCIDMMQKMQDSMMKMQH
jgi:esterase/lipase